MRLWILDKVGKLLGVPFKAGDFGLPYGARRKVDVADMGPCEVKPPVN